MYFSHFLLVGKEYDHTRHGISPAVMIAIKPVFDELGSRKFPPFLHIVAFVSLSLGETLSRALNGASQNSNESFHSLLWTMAPKSRFTSGDIMDSCVCLAVIIFNDGFHGLARIIRNLCGEIPLLMVHFYRYAFL
jgi:hypothetical protein